MKWGQRRARKQGRTYRYKSRDTKQFEKASKRYGDKKSKAIGDFHRNKNAYSVNPSSAEKQLRKINKYQDKQTAYKVMAKASSKFDKRFQNTVDREFKGKKGAAKYVALGPYGSKRYSEIMADNSKKIKKGRAYAASVIDQVSIFGGGLGAGLGKAASLAIAPSGREYYVEKEANRFINRQSKKKKSKHR